VHKTQILFSIFQTLALWHVLYWLDNSVTQPGTYMNCSNKTHKSVVFMHSNCDSNRDTAVPAERNGDLQTLICVLVARPRWCPTLSNPVPTKLNGGLSWLHSADEDAVLWLTSYGSWHNALMMMTKMMSKPHIKVTKKLLESIDIQATVWQHLLLV